MIDASQFREQLLGYVDELRQTLSTEEGDWVVKGFIDIYRNIYTISVDTKVISKIIELLMFPVIARFAHENDYQIVLSEHQNHYPDVTFIAQDGTKFALDFKSTYRTSENQVNGFTLGAFTGYFRDRTRRKNITFPYNDYSAHFVLGTIYSRSEDKIDERSIHHLDELHQIASVVKDFAFLLQEKWRLASDRPGSGNTKNIGSVRNIHDLIEGNGSFADYGVVVFDDYWMNFLTADMARAIDSVVPYKNLKGYLMWRDKAK